MKEKTSGFCELMLYVTQKAKSLGNWTSDTGTADMHLSIFLSLYNPSVYRPTIRNSVPLLAMFVYGTQMATVACRSVR
jgi:hypothetical protein